MKRIAVLISGSGTNFYNLAKKVRESLSTECKIEVVISNTASAKGLDFAKEFEIPSLVLEDKLPKVSIISNNAAEYEKFASMKLKAEEAFLKLKPHIKNEDFSLFDLMQEAISSITVISKFPEEDLKENVLTDLIFEGMTGGKEEVSEQEEDELISKIDDILYDLIEEVKILATLFLQIKENPAFLNFFARERYDNNLSKVLEERQIEYIFLAGFMHILSPSFVQKWQGKILNIHPSLLPSFRGAKAVHEALKYGVKVTGATVHFVETGVDSGKIIAQKPVEISKEDTAETLHAKIKEVEKELYTKVLEDLIKNRL